MEECYCDAAVKEEDEYSDTFTADEDSAENIDSISNGNLSEGSLESAAGETLETIAEETLETAAQGVLETAAQSVLETAPNKQRDKQIVASREDALDKQLIANEDIEQMIDIDQLALLIVPWRTSSAISNKEQPSNTPRVLGSLYAI